MKQSHLAFIITLVVCVSPSFASAYEIWVTDQGKNEVRVFDGETFDTIAVIPTESKPHNIEPVLGGTFVYISNIGSGSMQILDALTYTVFDTIPTGRGAHGVNLSPGEHFLYVTNTGEQTVTIIKTPWDVVRHIPVDTIPSVVSFTPDWKKAYVAHVSGTLSVIDTTVYNDPATYKVIKKIPNLKGAIVLAMSRDGKKLYVARGIANKVAVVDTKTDRVIKNIRAGKDSHSVWLTPDGKQIWVVNRLGGSISVIRVKTDTVIRTIKTSFCDKPDILAFSPDGGLAFITCRGIAQTGDPNVLSGIPRVIVIDVKLGKVVRLLSVKGDPHGIAVRP